jgi:hypothetical protein
MMKIVAGELVIILAIVTAVGAIAVWVARRW